MTDGKVVVSIVIPAYNESQCLEKSIEVINKEALKTGIAYEIIIIDDGSSDETWLIIERLVKKLSTIKAYQLSRNFGKEAALSAGIEKSSGEAVITIDADLQHPPTYIPEMVRRWQDNQADIVECVKVRRGSESKINKLGASIFYTSLRLLSGYDLSGVSDFKLMDRKVVEAWRKMGENNLFYRGMVAWLGFERDTIYFEVPNRLIGNTRWSKLALIRLAIQSALSFSNLPMRAVTFLGLIFFVLAVFLSIHSLIMYFGGYALTGFTTVILLLLIIGSIIMMSLGIIGEYIANIYNEVKSRPRYIISRTTHRNN